ncbi:PorT family protein [Mucilaginibacter sp. HMF5004]|uniref:porin family protein n=1 Tax=Mucilaginibacter rivuli TaxID=2857527 RepID=UPI001C604818|nr:porin family protein [Mucilaginibacter rivuli]MBW4890729.1 PorT family protein [Mucilaginibacter rivuli]
MKKFLIFPIFFVLICNYAVCQDLKYGIRAGLCFSSQSIENPDILSTTSINSLKVTAFVDKALGNDFYIEPGISLVGKGVKLYQNAQTDIISLTYLDVPLNLIYKFNVKRFGKLFVGGGPYVGVGLSGNDETQSTNTTSGQSVTFSGSEDYKKIELGGNINGGAELNNHLTFYLNYEFGLNNIAGDQIKTAGTLSAKNRVFSVGLGFLF